MATIRYPLDIVNANSSYITFTLANNRGFKTSELKNISDAQFKTKTTDIIAMPLPNGGFSDASSIGYTDIQDTSLIGIGGQALANKLDPSGKGQQEAKMQSGTTKATQQMMLFDSVAVKNFSFAWDLVPESSNEMLAIENIIQLFENAKLPYYNTGKLLLNFPDVVKINFGGIKPKLINFLPSLITGIQATYGEGDFQIYKDGGFPKISLNVSFTEITSRTRDIQKRLYSSNI